MRSRYSFNQFIITSRCVRDASAMLSGMISQCHRDTPPLVARCFAIRPQIARNSPENAYCDACAKLSRCFRDGFAMAPQCNRGDSAIPSVYPLIRSECGCDAFVIRIKRIRCRISNRSVQIDSFVRAGRGFLKLN